MTATTWRRGLAGLLSVFAFLAGTASYARAAVPSYIPTTPAPFVVLQIESGSVTVRTWDRAGVQLIADPGITSNHAPTRQVAARAPRQIMLWSETITTPAGALNLAPEPFLLPPFPPGEHDALIVRGSGNVTLTVPEQTPLVLANVRTGSVNVDNFHGNALVVHVGSGNVRLDDDSGTAAVQVNSGPVYAANSVFERLRLRTGRGNVVMNNCRANQIQVTSLVGSILYDDGIFEPGIARFETNRGMVAIGIANGAQIEAHSGVGRIFYDVGPDGTVNRGPTDTQATIMGGGPVVTASSVSGAVIFYRGSLRDHPMLDRRLGRKLRSDAPDFQQP